MNPPSRMSVMELAVNDPSVDPLSIDYVRLLRFFMSLTGSWPYEAFTGKKRPILKLSFPCLGFTVTVGQILYLKENYKRLPFFDIGLIYMTTFFGTLSSIRTFLPLFQAHGVIIQEFLTIFHLVHFKHKGGYHQKIYAKVEWVSYRAVVFIITSGLICAFSFNLIPIANNLRSGAYHDQNVTTELAVYYSYPYFNTQAHIGVKTVCDTFLVTLCVLLIISIDSLMFIIVFQIIGHIEILRHTLTQFPKSESDIQPVQRGSSRLSSVAVGMLNHQQNLKFAETIKQCVQHHIFIVKFTEKVSAFFGPLLAVYYVFYLVTGCLMLLELSAGDAASIMRYGPGTVGMFTLLILLSTVFEVVKTKSDSLVHVLYSQPWESASVPNQRSVCMLLRRFQTPIVFRALGVIPVNVQTMAEILKTSFSYFAFLQTLNN